MDFLLKISITVKVRTEIIVRGRILSVLGIQVIVRRGIPKADIYQHLLLMPSVTDEQLCLWLL